MRGQIINMKDKMIGYKIQVKGISEKE